MSAIAVVLLEKGYTRWLTRFECLAILQAGQQTRARHPGTTCALPSRRTSWCAPRLSGMMTRKFRYARANIPVIKRENFFRTHLGERNPRGGWFTRKDHHDCHAHRPAGRAGIRPQLHPWREIKELGTNARWDVGRHFVVEADEYDRMFLGLSPRISVVTNIEHDHPDCFPTPRDYLDAFVSFVNRTIPNGKSILCGDDPGVNNLLKTSLRPDIQLLTYGFAEGCDYRIEDYAWKDSASHFSLRGINPINPRKNWAISSCVCLKAQCLQCRRPLAVVDALRHGGSAATPRGGAPEPNGALILC